jgi:hypothetical protein
MLKMLRMCFIGDASAASAALLDRLNSKTLVAISV